MGIGRIDAMGSTAGAQSTGAKTTKNQPMDSVSKGIQNEIADVQRQMQGLSSKEDITAEEKSQKRQELQKQISKLNVELRQRQTELHKEQRKEELAAGNKDSSAQKEEKKTAKTEDADKAKRADKAGNINQADTVSKAEKAEALDSGKAPADSRKVVAAETSVEQIQTQGRIIARIEGGIAILKGEIKQDEMRGENVEKKKEELERRQERVERAADFQTSIMKEAGKKMKETTRTDADKKEKTGSGRGVINATNFSRDNQQGTQPFYIQPGIL